MSHKIQSESEAAHLFREAYKDRVRFIPTKNRWLINDGPLWIEDERLLLDGHVREFLDFQATTDPRWRGALATIRNVKGLAERDPALHVDMDHVDCKPLLIGTKSYVYNARTAGRSRSPRGTYITKRCSVDPDFENDCPRWKKFIRQLADKNSEREAYLQRWCGYALTGDVRHEKMLIMTGGGENGKSKFFNAVAEIMGSYHAEAKDDTFVDAKSKNRHEQAMAHISGARLVTCSEIEEAQTWSEATLKKVVSGDYVTARFLYKNLFTFRPSCKVWVMTNHLPKLKSVGTAMRRRVDLFEIAFSPKNKDEDLEHQLRKEYGAILAWMLEGAGQWCRYGLQTPQSVTNATDRYFDDQDTLGQWLKEKTRKSEGCVTPTAELHASYNRFLRENGLPDVFIGPFAKQLVGRGYEKRSAKSARTRSMKGIRLKMNT
jgi:putative DNA primase/helicase